MSAAHAITSKNEKYARNGVFRSKQTTKKVASNIFRGFEEGRKV